MRRDPEVILRILRHVEEADEANPGQMVTIHDLGLEPAVVAKHVQICADEGLLTIIREYYGGEFLVELTQAGHKYIDRHKKKGGGP